MVGWVTGGGSDMETRGAWSNLYEKRSRPYVGENDVDVQGGVLNQSRTKSRLCDVGKMQPNLGALADI
jgi:hypothetical protein